MTRCKRNLCHNGGNRESRRLLNVRLKSTRHSNCRLWLWFFFFWPDRPPLKESIYTTLTNCLCCNMTTMTDFFNVMRWHECLALSNPNGLAAKTRFYVKQSPVHSHCSNHTEEQCLTDWTRKKQNNNIQVTWQTQYKRCDDVCARATAGGVAAFVVFCATACSLRVSPLRRRFLNALFIQALRN